MPGKRADGKEFIGWWAPSTLKKRLKEFTSPRAATDTDVLNEALSDWLDEHETTETAKEQDR